LRANHAFQAVVVPAGKSQVKLKYESRAFRAGGVISLAGGLAIACLVLFGNAGSNKR
jgi:hypothetical protein